MTKNKKKFSVSSTITLFLESQAHKRDIKKALQVIKKTGIASTATLQKEMHIGYSKSCLIMESLEMSGLVGPALGNIKRKIYF